MSRHRHAGIVNTRKPKVGERRWSTYFNNWIYLHRYTSDVEWWYRVGDPNTGAFYKSQVRWSSMPFTKKEATQ
jgi:hypothetical protein